MILLPWYMYWLSLSAAMLMGFVLCAMLAVGGRVAMVETPADYIDWSKIPDGYDFVAVDEDGTVCKYSGAAPKINEDPPVWIVSEDGNTWYPTDKITNTASIIGPLPPWRESLRRRPGK